jgi:hypothetical protein
MRHTIVTSHTTHSPSLAVLCLYSLTSIIFEVDVIFAGVTQPHDINGTMFFTQDAILANVEATGGDKDDNKTTCFSYLVSVCIEPSQSSPTVFLLWCAKSSVCHFSPQYRIQRESIASDVRDTFSALTRASEESVIRMITVY